MSDNNKQLTLAHGQLKLIIVQIVDCSFSSANLGLLRSAVIPRCEVLQAQAGYNDLPTEIWLIIMNLN